MKTLLISAFASLSLLVNTCNEKKSDNNVVENSTEKTNTVETTPNDVSIILKKDNIYEIAYAAIDPSKQELLFKQYFPQAGPIIAAYGGKNLASFSVVAIKPGGTIDKPSMVVLFEWPSVEVYKKTISDSRLKKLFPLRDSAFNDFGQAFATVKEDTPITFKADKDYEFFMAWLKPNGKAPLGQYFKVSAPIKKSYGKPAPVFKANLSPVNINSTSATVLNPHMMGIVEWDKHTDYDVMIKNTEFKTKAQKLYDTAVDRNEMIHGKLILQ